MSQLLRAHTVFAGNFKFNSITHVTQSNLSQKSKQIYFSKILLYRLSLCSTRWPRTHYVLFGKKKKQKYQQNIRESIEIKTQSIQSHMRPGKPIGLALLTLVTGPPWHLQADVLMAQTLHPAQN